MASGCTASRASVAGACLGALYTESAIPAEWISLTKDSSRVSALADELLEIRQQVHSAKM